MKPIAAHVIIKKPNGSILLTQRNDVPIWVIPGGHIEGNETPEQGVRREIHEELGLDIINLNHMSTYYFDQKKYCKYVYIAELKDLKQNISQNNEVKSYDWFSLDKLPTPITTYELQKIHDYKKYIGKVIVKDVYISKKGELLNLLKNPINFIYVITFVLKNKFTTNTFKI